MTTDTNWKPSKEIERIVLEALWTGGLSLEERILLALKSVRDLIIAEARPQIEAEAQAKERKRCAKIVKGEVYREFYRTWDYMKGQGNLRDENSIVKHSDHLVTTILNEKQP